MRMWGLLGVVGAATVGCVLDVALPGVPAPVYHADCGANPSALAHIAGLQAGHMLIDETAVYVIASEDDDPTRRAIWQVPLRDTHLRRLANGLPPIEGMAPNWDSIVITTNADGGATGEVLDIRPPAMPVPLATNRPVTGAVFGDANRVYWAEEGIDSSGQPFGAIMTTAQSGDGGVATLQRMSADEIPRQFGTLEWAAATGPGAEWLYWTTGDPAHPTPGQGEIHGCALPTPLSPVIRIDEPDGGGAGAFGLTVSGDSGTQLGVLYSGPRGITMVTLEPDGGIAAARAFVPTAGFVERMTTVYGRDPTPVFYVDPSTGALMSQVTQNASAATARRLATGVDPATALRADDACVYWIDAHAGNVMMIHQ